MPVRLTIVSGPHRGRTFEFDSRDLFLVGRAQEAHFQVNEPSYSRIHFMLELNPPWCRLTDPGSRQGTFVNEHRVQVATLHPGDEIKAGHSVFRFAHVAADGTEVTAWKPASLESSGTLKPLVDPPRPTPLAIPGYRYVRELGAGVLGRVCLVVREQDNVELAVKAIRPAVQDDLHLLERFLEEAQILGQLVHPHIVEFFEVGRLGELLYLVMEYVRGEDLSQVLSAHERLEIPIAVRMTCQLLDALAFGHERGMIHWDVKPTNVMLAKEAGKRPVKIADFSVAHLYRASPLSGLPVTSAPGDSAAYVAPEQITHYRSAGPAIDQYSAAAVLYHALCGAAPYPPQRNAAAMFRHILQESPQPLRDRRPGVPASLAEVIHRALRKEPAGRFPSARDFRNALAPFAK